MAVSAKAALTLILCVTAADAFSSSLVSLNSVTRSQRASTGVLATSMKGGKKRKVSLRPPRPEWGDGPQYEMTKECT